MKQLSLAVDMGGSHIACALLSGCSILSKTAINVSGTDFQESVAKIEGMLLGKLHDAGAAATDCAGVGIGFCGIVDARNQVVLATNGKYEGAAGFDFCAWSQRALGLRLRIENDARLALMGEHFHGAARGYSDAVMVTLGTGIGGAALIGGKPIRSKHGKAGAIGGHLPIVLDGHRCSCGNIGCCEAEASTSSLPAMCREWPDFAQSALAHEARIDFELLFHHADVGDRIALEVLNHCCHVWSVLSVALIHAYDPEVMVFGGGIMKRANYLLPKIRDYVNRHAWMPGSSVALVAAELNSDAALYGAIPLLADLT